MARKHYAKDKTATQNVAKTLLANIRFASVDDPIRTIVMTSTMGNEGKSTVSINLARAIATSGKTVLLVECDMLRRSLANMLRARGKAGLYSVLVGQTPLEEAVTPLLPEGMFFLDAEPSIPSPSDIIISKRFKTFLASAEEKYDYVIFDTPPIGVFVDAAVLSSLVDGTIIVVREDYVPREGLQNTYEQLKKADANVIGVVMNYCDYRTKGYGYGYGYESYAKSSSKSSSGSSSRSSEASSGHGSEHTHSAKPMVPAAGGVSSHRDASSRGGKRFSK